MRVEVVVMVVIGMQVELRTRAREGREEVVVRQGEVQTPWKEETGSICTPQFYESSHHLWREFHLLSPTDFPPLTFQVTSPSLSLTVSPSLLPLLSHNPTLFTVSYHCTDFTEGVHPVTIQVSNGSEQVSIRYSKVCGRPYAAHWDVAQTLLLLFQCVFPPLVALYLPSQTNFHLISIRFLLKIAAIFGILLIFSLAFALKIIFKVTFSAILTYFAIKITLKSMFSEYFPTNQTLISLILSIFTVILYLFTDFWLLNDILTCIFVIFIAKYCQLDCGKCGFGLIMLTFLYEISRIFYISLKNEGEISIWLSEKCNWPLSVSIPRLNSSVLRGPCAVVGLMDLVYPCLVLNFAIRLDRYYGHSHYYRYLLAAYVFTISLCSLLHYLSDVPVSSYLILTPLFLLTTVISTLLTPSLRNLSSLWLECE